MDHLSDTNLDELETIIQSICPVLKEKINQFKAQQGKLPNIYTDSEACTGARRFTFKEFPSVFNKEAGRQVEVGGEGRGTKNV